MTVSECKVMEEVVCPFCIGTVEIKGIEFFCLCERRNCVFTKRISNDPGLRDGRHIRVHKSALCDSCSEREMARSKQ